MHRARKIKPGEAQRRFYNKQRSVKDRLARRCRRQDTLPVRTSKKNDARGLQRQARQRANRVMKHEKDENVKVIECLSVKGLKRVEEVKYNQKGDFRQLVRMYKRLMLNRNNVDRTNQAAKIVSEEGREVTQILQGGCSASQPCLISKPAYETVCRHHGKRTLSKFETGKITQLNRIRSQTNEMMARIDLEATHAARYTAPTDSQTTKPKPFLSSKQVGNTRLPARSISKLLIVKTFLFVLVLATQPVQVNAHSSTAVLALHVGLVAGPQPPNHPTRNTASSSQEQPTQASEIDACTNGYCEPPETRPPYHKEPDRHHLPKNQHKQVTFSTGGSNADDSPYVIRRKYSGTVEAVRNPNWTPNQGNALTYNHDNGTTLQQPLHTPAGIEQVGELHMAALPTDPPQQPQQPPMYYQGSNTVCPIDYRQKCYQGLNIAFSPAAFLATGDTTHAQTCSKAFMTVIGMKKHY